MGMGTGANSNNGFEQQGNLMTKAKLKRRFSRPVRDFALGLTVFAGSSLSSATEWMQLTGLICGSAHARRVEVEPMPAGAGLGDQTFDALSAMPGPSLGSLEHMSLFLTLALAFAAVFALNLWFARHVKRVHASYRKRR